MTYLAEFAETIPLANITEYLLAMDALDSSNGLFVEIGNMPAKQNPKELV